MQFTSQAYEFNPFNTSKSHFLPPRMNKGPPHNPLNLIELGNKVLLESCMWDWRKGIKLRIRCGCNHTDWMCMFWQQSSGNALPVLWNSYLSCCVLIETLLKHCWNVFTCWNPLWTILKHFLHWEHYQHFYSPEIHSICAHKGK